MRILVVEDDAILADVVVQALQDNHYAVDTAADGMSGWDCAESAIYDLILIDVGLPKLDGISLCQKIRGRGCGTPILLMTAKDDSAYRIRGLDSGADDYLSKPLDLAELQARVRALLRRGTVASSTVLSLGLLQLDPKSCQASYAEQLLPLTPKEYSLLELLLRHPTRVFSCGDIIEHLWNFDDPPQEESVKSHIKGLRQKLKAEGAADWIENVYGLGYRLREGIQAQPPQPKPSYSVAMAQLWEQYRGLMEERFAVLQQAVETRPLSPELRQAAGSAAHKLAGVLGMFDRPEGTDLARQLETLFEKSVECPTAEVQSLVQRLGDILNLSSTPADPTQNSLTPSPAPNEGSASQQREGPTSVRSWTILAVDDDPIILATLKQLLEPWGMCVTGIDDPLQFWAMLSGMNPDLLILDVEMPQLNGVALCQAVRANPTWQSLPVIFLTAHQETVTVQQIFAAGADDYVVKPVVGQELVSRITQRLERLRLLQSLATKDAITGLSNQSHSSQAIAALMTQAPSGCFAIARLLTLRKTNLQLGHGAGNQLLKQFAQHLTMTFGQDVVLGYWGNGEFAIGSARHSKDAVQALLRGIPIDHESAVVQYPADGFTVQSLYQAANLCLGENS